MVKYVFLVRPPDGVDGSALRARVLGEVVPRLLQMGPDRLKVGLTEPRRPRLTVLPLGKQELAMISLWDAQPDRAGQWPAAMAGPGWSVAGYRVTESTPLGYTKDWPDGEASPGVVMLTLMRRNPRLSQEQFMREWFEYHTPRIALKVHPLWNYIRNVVESALPDESPHLDGIVEEHCRERRELTNPVRYFGGPLRMVSNMIRVGLHANKFLEISAVENYLLTEYHIRS